MRTTTEMKIGMAFPQEIAVFDLETTSPDPQQARIVTCFIGIMNTATREVTERWSWVVNPGVPIPREASDIHGYTTERVLVEGGDPKQAVFEISQRLDIIHKRSIAIVAMNAVYDFTVLDREMLRYWPGMRPLISGVWERLVRTAEDPAGNLGDWVEADGPGLDAFGKPTNRWRIIDSPVIFDPMVYDRAIDKYRKGSRKLVDLARTYGVPVAENAHDAEADCIMAGGVAIELLKHSRIQDMSLSEVHAKLIPTKRNQTIGPDGLAAYWKKKAASSNNPAEREDLLARIKNVEQVGHYWPLIPRTNGA